MEMDAREDKAGGGPKVGPNTEFMELFPEGVGEVACFQTAVLACIVGLLSTFGLIVFSGVAEVGYKAYDVFVQLESVWHIFVGMGVIGFLSLHVLNWYRWPIQWKAICGAIVMYLIMIGIACHTKRYPSGPLIVFFLQFPIALALFRLAAGRQGSVISFFRAAIICFGTSAFYVLLVWVAWIFAADMKWGASTKADLRSKLKSVFKRYDLTWERCEAERALVSGEDDTVIAYCSRMELISFLIWSCPFIEFLVLIAITIFCAQRYWVLRKGASIPERILRLVVFLLCGFATLFWIACSTAGASMGLSRVMFASIAIAGLCFVVWLIFAVDLSEVMLKAKDTVVYKTVIPALGSDYFTAAMLCASQFVVIGFLSLECVVRQLEKLCGVEGENSLLTRRGRRVADFISAKHWASTLEKSFNLCMLFLVFFLFSRFTPVFLAALGDQLETMNFGAVCGIFYVVGIIMFLLPPVPGVPVYMAAGTIIVDRGRQESWLNFWSGIAFASVLSLILKLSAVVLQQKGIGEMFGKSLSVQQLVGVHTTSIRAIEKILKKPGLTLEKVAILCGGPDWPTSVLTGILGLDLLPMLIGTLPCFFLIVPCVLGGASLTEESLKSFSPIIIMMVGVTQGGVMLGALVFIAKETERSQDELSKPREEHSELVKKSEEIAKQVESYKKFTTWRLLTATEKFFLVQAVFVEVMICWIFQFMGGTCFRAFAIGSKISWSHAQGGLNNNAWSMIRGPGYSCFGAIIYGIVLMSFYSCLVRRRLRKEMTQVYNEESGEPAHEPET